MLNIEHGGVFHLKIIRCFDEILYDKRIGTATKNVSKTHIFRFMMADGRYWRTHV